MIRKSELTMALLAAFFAPMLWGTMVLVMMYSHTPDGRFPMTFDTLPIVEITVLSLFMGTILAIAIDALIRHTVHRRWPLVYEVVAGATPKQDQPKKTPTRPSANGIKRPTRKLKSTKRATM